MRTSSIGLILAGIMLITTTGVSCKLFNKETPPVDNSNVVVEPETMSVNVTINDGTTTKDYTLIVPTNSTVDEVMEQANVDSDMQYISKENAGLGKFVDSIGGVVSDASAGKFWSYTINGEAVATEPGDTVVQEGDIIRWEYKGL